MGEGEGERVGAGGQSPQSGDIHVPWPFVENAMFQTNLRETRQIYC